MVNGPQQQSSLVATASSHSSTSSAQTTRIRTSLLAKSESALTELTTAHHDYISGRTTRRHGALALAIGRAQQVLKALDGAREWEQCCSRTSSSSSSSPSSLSSQASSRGDDVGLVARLEEVRRRLRRVVERAVSAIDEDGDSSSNNNSSGSGSGSGGTSSRRSAASSATALRSLLHTRSMLSVELQKMDTAVQGLAGSGEAINTLHNSLQDVHASMATAQRMVRSLLTVQSRDDLVLRLSAVVFVLVVLFVVAQRVFRFFPATVYMSVQ